MEVFGAIKRTRFLIPIRPPESPRQRAFLIQNSKLVEN